MAANKKTSLEAGAIDTPQNEPPMTLSEENLGQLEHPSIEVPSMEDVIKKDYVDTCAFMEEEVEIYIAPIKGERQEVPVSPTVNGIRQHIFRGVPQKVKRKYLEPLGRALIVDYEQDEETMYRTGELPRAIVSASFPFTILHDSPKGIAWQRELQMRG